MANPEETVEPDKQGVGHTLTEDNAFKAWEHFATTGGADKNTMTKVVSWLLAFSSAIIGYIVANPLNSNSLLFSKPVATHFLAGIGFVVSIAAGSVAFIYGRYARTNWARADMIASARGWHELFPKTCTRRIAPIFWIYMVIAVLSGVIHLAFLLRC
jgi:hypothetical protein